MPHPLHHLSVFTSSILSAFRSSSSLVLLYSQKVFTIEDTEKPPLTTLGDKTKIAQLEQEIMSLKQHLNSPSSNSSSDVSKNRFKCQ